MTANKGQHREPRLVASRGGTRLFSMAALAERIREEFMLEYRDTEALREADAPSKRMRLVLAVTDYVIAVESITMTSDDKATLMQRVYSELFGYGALDPFLADPRVTTIALNGAERAAVRYGHNELTDVSPLFEDGDQLQTIIERLLLDAGASLRSDSPIIETGLNVGERRISLSVVTPTFGVSVSADIRLHPQSPPSLDALVEQGVLSAEAADVLRRLAASNYGLVIAGEAETGKTTLMNALALKYVGGGAAVERTGEMRLPESFARFQPTWGRDDSSPVAFGERLIESLNVTPPLLMVDEVRADDPTAVAPLLRREDAPRQWWVFRGAPDHKRLQSALGMLARRAESGAGETLVHALYERLPFVISVARIQGRLKLFSIAEWQSRIDTDYPDYVQLFRYDQGMARRTEALFARWL
ncbi:MAG: Flp pilus assembly complex ATPase component TadA [Anaerolineae bacterium]|nr:Flp pilus assembly complex ATPase component TadA [Anaerolineae bacterium]NUQ02389.1 Flp pilus assembly complex ATPase component TadA [Anaerolineae bacterium]